MIALVEQPKILTIDSSSLAGSVALCQGETLLAESLLNVQRTHSDTLLKQIDLLLAEADWTLSDLDLLAAVIGPGSFTGLRIGIATIKGLAEVLAKPVVGISSLQMLAMNLPLVQRPICTFLDARKKEVYSQLFEWSAAGPVPTADARVLPPEELLNQLEGEVALVGDGVPLYRHLITRILGERAHLPVLSTHQPRAAQAGWLAGRAYAKGALMTAAELLPTYIRPSDAELHQVVK